MEYTHKHKLNIHPLACPIPVYNIDGTANKSGAITGVMDMVLHYKGHTKRAQFAITGLGRQDVILSYTWLHEHNPEVNWQTNEVKMNWCPTKCRTCMEEEKADKQEQHVDLQHIQTCCAGPTPSVDDDLHGIPDTTEIEEEDKETIDKDDCPLEEGDCIFVVHLWDKPEEVCTLQNVSSRLVEAFHKNSTTTSFCNSAPDYLHEFKDVFSKESFDVLPECKLWDHAIELTPDAETKSCKVYPLSVAEQWELDKFLEENLALG